MDVALLEKTLPKHDCVRENLGTLHLEKKCLAVSKDHIQSALTFLVISFKTETHEPHHTVLFVSAKMRIIRKFFILLYSGPLEV